MITKKELENLALLARIELKESDKDSLIKEFDSILNYVDQLKKADVNIDTESRVGSVRNVIRDDVSETTTAEDRRALIDSAPHKEGDFIATKKIIEQ
jgi:aspartyl-tRNA(Asn)/glutamyl-tRNA(Gln) amidotransferase subunit C